LKYILRTEKNKDLIIFVDYWRPKNRILKVQRNKVKIEFSYGMLALGTFLDQQ